MLFCFTRFKTRSLAARYPDQRHAGENPDWKTGKLGAVLRILPKKGQWRGSWLYTSGVSRLSVRDQIVNWKTDSPKRMLGTCQNPIIDPANAARSMIAAST
jgi:hypothetical protein